MVGSWETKVSTSGMPQKIATAVGELQEKLIGAQYTPIAYLGTQLVNGVNHAVLAEQLLTTGKDTKNIVVLIFNEKDGVVTLSNIERVIEGGPALGGVTIDVHTDIPEDAQQAFDATISGFVGSTVKPFALLATHVTNQVEYIFAAEVAPVVAEPESHVAIVSIRPRDKAVSFTDILNAPTQALGYAFTWLKANK